MHLLLRQRSKELCLLMAYLFCFFIAEAQVTLRGKVVDNTGTPVAGVTVSIRNKPDAVTTDSAGNYLLRPVLNDVIIFSYVGYTSREIVYDTRFNSTIVMQISSNSLESVVVTGYSSQKKRDLTGAVSVVNTADLIRQPTGQVTNQLQGLASGVTILSSGQPGEEAQVAIRGLNTFGNNTPLYVIDGVPTQNLKDINPNDIASIQVLKDAGAASIYGSRASNGVLIVTTKRGNGKVKVQYSGYYGNKQPVKGNVWDLLSSQDMANLEWQAKRNSGVNPANALYGSGTTPVLPDYIMPVGAKEGDASTNPSLYNVNPDYTTTDEFNSFYRITKANKTGTDWYHEVFKPASIQSHNISVSGGGSQGNFLFSLNYLNDEGNMIYTYLKRYTIRSNAQFNVSDRIRIGENITYAISENPVSATNDQGSAISFTYRQQRLIPVYDIEGNFGGAYTTGGQLLGNGNNPVAIQYRTRNNKGQTNRLFGNVYAEADLLKNLTFRTSFGGETSSADFRSFSYPEYENPENSVVNSYSENGTRGFNWTWTNTLSYQATIGSFHSLKALAGIESYKNKSSVYGISNTDYFSFSPDFTTISSGAGSPSASSSRSADALSSYFGRIDYAYKDKYLLAATVRRDGSSKFLNYRWGWFPAFSAGWRISDEPFMKQLSWLSDFKLRGSWGIMGNQINVNAANSFTTFGGDRGSSYYDITGSNNQLQQGFSQTTLGNPNAKWEKNVNANIGADISLFTGKVQISADYYRKDIRDLLYNPDLPGTAGQSQAPFINIASMKNTGIDASVTGNFALGADIKLSGILTFTTYKNEITKVTDITDYFSLIPKRFGIDIIRNQVGSSISSFYGYAIEGFWNSQSEINTANQAAQNASGNPAAVYQQDVRPGHFRYKDVNGDGSISDNDRTILGNPNPDFSYGLNLALAYKNFDFSMFFYGVSGNELWNQTKWWTDFYSSLGPGAKSNTAYYNSWTPERTNAAVSIQESVASFGTSSVPNSYYVEKGSYLRAKNAQLGYTLPSGLLKKLSVSQLRIYIQAANFFTITRYSGIDPEVTGSTTSFGIDEGGYAQPKQFVAGINLNF